MSTNKNITCVGLSPDGTTAILVDEGICLTSYSFTDFCNESRAELVMCVNSRVVDGAAVLVSLLTRAVLHHHHFHKPVHSIRFSPDGK